MSEHDGTGSKGGLVFGGIFILIGALLLLNVFFKSDIFSMGNLWPIFVLVPGLLFEASYYTNRKAPGLLVPGGILTTISLLFFFEIATGWSFAAYTWPVYILGVIIGLFQFYLNTGKPKGLLVAITVLTLVAAISAASIACHVFFLVAPHRIILPAVLIGIGGYIVYRGFRK